MPSVPSVKLYSRNDGVYSHTYGEVGADPLITWVATEYTEETGLDECCACGEMIDDWALWVCLDDGDVAHGDCIEFWANAYSKDGISAHV